MTTLSPLRPFARLIRMWDGAVVATTTNLLRGSGRTARMDAAGGCTLVVPLGDAGVFPSGGSVLGAWDGGTAYSTGDIVSVGGVLYWAPAAIAAGMSPGPGGPWALLGFAANLVWAGGSPQADNGVPMLLSLSLDGGTTYDTHRLVQKPMRDMRPEGLTMTEEGDDIWSLYGMVAAGGGHLTLAGCSLADVLGQAPGAIVPLATGNFQEFLAANHHVPYACGLLYPTASLMQDIPGLSWWNSSALAGLRFTGVVATDGLTNPPDLAFTLPVTVDSWADSVQHAIATIVEKLGGAVLDGDTAPPGARGHYVADCSSAALNLSGRVAGVICNGTPTAGSLGTLSNAAPIARSVVIGAVGAAPTLSFDGTLTASDALDETTTARILSGVTIEPDLTTLFGQCAFEGGASDAGFPGGGAITALTQLNRGGGDAAWSTCLPIVGINVSDQSGGVYLYDTLGRLLPVNKSQSVPVLDMDVDTVNNVINIATPHGCYHRTSDMTDTSAAWTIIGGLTARAVRLLSVPTTVPSYILSALVIDPQTPDVDGVYRYYGGSPGTSGVGYNGWVRHGATTGIVDAVATDDHSFFYLEKKNQNTVYLYDYGVSPATTTAFALPANVNAIRLDRVTGNTYDTVYAVTTGDDQAAYYSFYDTGTNTWQPFVPAYLAVGALLKVNSFYGPLESINPASAITVQVIACTANGLYYSGTNKPTGTGNWHSANGQNGLAGVDVRLASVGAAQVVLGQNMSRMYAASDTALYESHDAGVQWDNVTQGKVTLAPYFVDVIKDATGAYPTNAVRTLGPSGSSPIGLDTATTHVSVSSYQSFPFLPNNSWYYERRLNQRGGWEWRLVNLDCPQAHLQRDQLTDIEANESQGAGTASAILAAVSRTWLGANSRDQMLLHVPSSFTQTNAALRSLQSTEQVLVTLHGSIPTQTTAPGVVVETVYVDLEDVSFYVLDHRWQLAQDGGPYAETQTTLSTVLRTQPLSAADMAATLQRQLRDLKTYATGRRRQ